jgi:cytochrome P450
MDLKESPLEFDRSLTGDVRDPYPDFAERRRNCPVEGEATDDGGSFIVYRYADVARVLSEPEAFSSGLLTEIMGPTMGEHIILGMDGARHRRHRGLVSAAFATKALARWERDLIRPSSTSSSAASPPAAAPSWCRSSPTPSPRW